MRDEKIERKSDRRQKMTENVMNTARFNDNDAILLGGMHTFASSLQPGANPYELWSPFAQTNGPNTSSEAMFHEIQSRKV